MILRRTVFLYVLQVLWLTVESQDNKTVVAKEEGLTDAAPASKIQLIIIAIVAWVMVLLLCLLAIAIGVTICVCALRCKYQNNESDEQPTGKKSQNERKILKDEEEQVERVELKPLNNIWCSIDSLTNGNCKVNPNYSKVEYQSDLEHSEEIPKEVASPVELILYNSGYPHDFSNMPSPSTRVIGHPPLPSKRGTITDDYDDIYVQPPSNEKDLYSQLAKRHYDNIQREAIKLTRELGKGEFGTVWEGEWSSVTGGPKVVAIKTLHVTCLPKDRIKFLQEAVIIGQFRHPNIVKLFGVVKEGEPKMIVLELTSKGDLKNVLMSLRPMESQQVASEPVVKDLPLLLLKFSRQISDGMDYLSKKCFIHRDLAARNILVTEDYICKVGDFGMARDLEEDSCYMSKGGLIPVRWTAPEALNYGKFSTASDVWSFGVVLYEIWSLGSHPFVENSNDEAVSLIEKGYYLPPPPGCPRAVYMIMILCWRFNSGDRPRFSDIRARLQQPQSDILTWSVSDRTVHPDAIKLGQPVEMGKELFKDLQCVLYR